METRKQKGQIFSLDFLIAIGLVVLAMGIMLNFYEMNVNYAKEERVKAELTAIAMTASELMLNGEECLHPQFTAQGYTGYGCSNLTINSNLQKEDLMIPDNFSCRGEIDDVLFTNGDCTGDYTFAKDVAILERTFKSASNITKGEYNTCVDLGTDCGTIWEDKTLRVAVWRT